MKNLKTLVLIGITFLLMISASSCKKIQQDMFIKGLWRIDNLYLDTMSQNQMPVHFAGFVSGNSCCTYKLDFQAGDVVFGYYLVNDSFASVVVGNWEITKYNEMQLKIDSFADGFFTIDKTTMKNYNLSSDQNHVKWFDGVNPQLDTTATKIEIERI